MKAKIFAVLMLAAFVVSGSPAVFAQDQEAASDQQNEIQNDNVQQNNLSGEEAGKSNWVTYSIVAGSILGTYAYGAEVWSWGENDWRWADEGWFGENTDSGGSDKVGHLYAHYLGQRALNNIFEWSLGNKESALWCSVATTTAVGLFIEVGDATSGKYGFSYEDLVSDIVGIAAGALLETYPVADEFIGISWDYWPTDGFQEQTEGRKKLHMTSDYGGAKVLLNFKLAGFNAIGWDIPEFMRYIMLDVGYYARGYTKYDRDDREKERDIYVGVSLNFIEVVRDLFDGSSRNGRLSKAMQQPFKYYHVPVGYGEGIQW